MSNEIFISYRRSDEKGFTGRISDRLVNEFGNEQVFRDVEGLQAGKDFEQEILKNLSDANVVLAIIGKEWVGKRILRQPRIKQKSDFVRREIEHAIANNIPIIPVLIEDAPIPSKSTLPSSLNGLLNVQVARIRDNTFDNDLSGLIESINQINSDAGNLEAKNAYQWQKIEDESKSPLPMLLSGVAILVAAMLVFYFGFLRNAEPDNTNSQFDANDIATWTIPGEEQSRSKAAHVALQLALNELRLSTRENDEENSGYNIEKFTEQYSLGNIGWSAAFVSWCYLEAERKINNSPEVETPYFNSPATEGIAGALREKGMLETNLENPDLAMPGDVVFFKRGSREYAHAEIVYKIYNDTICSIAGNVDNGVTGRCRSITHPNISAIGQIKDK